MSNIGEKYDKTGLVWDGTNWVHPGSRYKNKSLRSPDELEKNKQAIEAKKKAKALKKQKQREKRDADRILRDAKRAVKQKERKKERAKKREADKKSDSSRVNQPEMKLYNKPEIGSYYAPREDSSKDSSGGDYTTEYFDEVARNLVKHNQQVKAQKKLNERKDTQYDSPTLPEGGYSAIAPDVTKPDVAPPEGTPPEGAPPIVPPQTPPSGDDDDNTFKEGETYQTKADEMYGIQNPNITVNVDDEDDFYSKYMENPIFQAYQYELLGK